MGARQASAIRAHPPIRNGRADYQKRDPPVRHDIISNIPPMFRYPTILPTSRTGSLGADHPPKYNFFALKPTSLPFYYHRLWGLPARMMGADDFCMGAFCVGGILFFASRSLHQRHSPAE